MKEKAKKRGKTGIVLGLLAAAMLFSAQFAPKASAIVAGEKIDSFNTSVTVNADSSINVFEKIQYDFGESRMHGIFRDIISKGVKINVLGVTDENNVGYIYAVGKSSDKVSIKIGDPNLLVSGIHNYYISYKVDNAIAYYKDFDEIYWNATGDQWSVPINNASVEVTLPKGANPVRSYCYAGVKGTHNTCGSNAQDLKYKTDVLAPGEGLTVAVDFPKGTITGPTVLQKFLLYLLVYWPFLIPVVVFIIMFIWWFKKGRDPKTGTIVAEYDAPDNLSPVEAAGIVKQKIEGKDISAEIIYLATKGYITITKTVGTAFLGLGTKVDYTLNLIKPNSDLDDFHTELLDKLFPEGKTEIKMSELKNKFYKEVGKLQKLGFKALVDKGFYITNPLVWAAVGAVSFAVVPIIFILADHGLDWVLAASLFACIPIMLLFAKIMPSVTLAGAEEKRKILGLKEYLQIAEKDRLAFHNAPEKSPKLFEKLLPYAMVLGVYEAWAKEFEGIYTTPPSWYQGPAAANFSAMVFASSMNSFNTDLAATMVSVPDGGGAGLAGGGGGFAGGGGGGGGGGSW